MRPRVGIVGLNGYSGPELVRLLAHHPQAEAVLLDHRSDSAGSPSPIGSKQIPRIPCTPEAVKAEGLALVFLATPVEASMELAPRMLEAGARVVDLSGAFRLGNLEAYRRWYKEAHTAPELLA